MKKIGLFLLAAAFTAAAHAQIQTLVLTSTAPSTGQCFADNWEEVSSGSPNWYIDTPSGFLSVSGSTVSAGSTKDVFTIANNTGPTGQIEDLTTKGTFLSPSTTSSTGFVAGTTKFTWDFIVNGSCPQTTTTPPPSGGGGTTTPPPPPPPPATTPSGTPTVMPIGDSITWGLDTQASEVQGGYRCAFYWNAITQLGTTFNMVGSSQNIPNETDSFVYPVNVGNTFPGCPANAQGWSGYGGTTISQLVSGGLVVGTNNFDYPGALGDVKTFQPDIVIFQGGTNDIALGPETINVTGDLTASLDAILAADPGALIVVAEIPEFVPGGNTVQPYYVTNVPIVNAQIAAVVQSMQNAGQNVILDTSYVGIPATVANFPDDFGHPSASVYITHANALANELVPYLKAIAASPKEQKAAVVSQKVRTAVTIQSMVVARPATN
jgi:hypothetical protein